MPQDTPQLRADLTACLPSLKIESVAAESGQRVVYFGRFDDSLIPNDVEASSNFLHGWAKWNTVVIKVVAGASPEELTRLEAESRILREVKSHQFPTLLFCNLFVDDPVTDSKFAEALYVAIEEYVESQPLSKLIDGYVGHPKSVLAIARGIVTALLPLWSHPKRFVHRDIKPENVLIRPDQSVVVIDFGIARETGTKGVTKTGWGKAPLTIDYAAPEHIANDKDSVSFKTDFFAIGVLMYRLLAGTHPFRNKAGMGDYDVAMAVETTEPEQLGVLGWADQQTSDLVHWLLRKSPYQRPRTPEILLDAIDAIAGK